LAITSRMYALASPLVVMLLNLASAAARPENLLSAFMTTPSIPISVLPSGTGSSSRAALSPGVRGGLARGGAAARGNVFGVSKTGGTDQDRVWLLLFPNELLLIIREAMCFE
jgi:hypothetical protein